MDSPGDGESPKAPATPKKRTRRRPVQELIKDDLALMRNVQRQAAHLAELEAAAASRRGTIEAVHKLNAMIESARRSQSPAGLDMLRRLAELEAAVPSGALDQIRQTRARYEGIIDQARDTAVRSYERAEAGLEPPATIEPNDEGVPWPEEELLTALRDEVSRVNNTVGDMASSVATMAVVASDAQQALIELTSLGEATLAESGKLRTTLDAGQRSADRAAKAIIAATVVLVILTLVLVALTGVLVWIEVNG